MSAPVKAVKRRGRKVLVIDFWYVDQHGKRKRYRRDAQAATKTGAQDEARRLMDRAARTGSPFAREVTGTRTLGSFVEDIYKTHFLPKKRQGTQERYENILDLHVLPFFGSTPLGKIRSKAFIQFETYLLGKGITSPRHQVSLLRAVLRAAVAFEELDAMPTDLPRYKQPKKIPICPSVDDVRLLLEHSGDGWLRLAVALMVFAGMRVSEARALEVRDVDLASDTLFVRRSYSGDKGGGVKTDETKDSDHRPVPINPALRPYLVRAIQGKGPTDSLLVTEDGNVPRRQHVRDRLVRTQERNGLTMYSPHKLRHFFASYLLARGAHIEAVRQLTGHSDLKVLARYAHANRQDLIDAVNKLT